MPGDDKAVARTATVVVLLLLGIIALRGYLPGAEPETDAAEQSPGGSSVVAILVMLGVSIAIMVIAIIGQTHRSAVPGAGKLSRDRLGGRLKVPWRLVLIVAAALLIWLLILLFLMRWGSEVAVEAVPLTDDESVTLPDGDRTETPEAPPEGGLLFGVLTAAMVVLLTLSLAGALIGRRRADPASTVLDRADSPSVNSPAAPDLAKATELGLVEMSDRSRTPREAIIACYAAMERELEKSPGTTPLDSDTPAEVLARAVEHDALQADSAAELVDLFEEARFSPHVMNEGHRADALQALLLVQRELQGAT